LEKAIRILAVSASADPASIALASAQSATIRVVDFMGFPPAEFLGAPVDPKTHAARRAAVGDALTCHR
jgi:hypothetical protein